MGSQERVFAERVLEPSTSEHSGRGTYKLLFIIDKLKKFLKFQLSKCQVNYAITKDKAAALEQLKASYEKQLEMLRQESKYSLDLLTVVVYVITIGMQV